VVPTIREPDGTITLLLDAVLYPLGAAQKAAHAFTGLCFVSLTKDDEEVVRCHLRLKQGVTHEDLVGAFLNELLDQQLRVRLRQESEPIRRLILAQAFSLTDAAAGCADDGDKG